MTLSHDPILSEGYSEQSQLASKVVVGRRAIAVERAFVLYEVG